jgi:hypothetical protein
MTATQVFFTRLWIPPVMEFANLHSRCSRACAFPGEHSQVSPLPETAPRHGQLRSWPRLRA